MMNFEQTVKWLYEELPMFSKIGVSAYNEGLENISAMLQDIENPHEKYKTIHVAGTNGKGSTSHMLASIFYEQGYKVGLFTSPHLKSFTERIKVNGTECEQQFVVDFVAQHQAKIKELKLSFFELTTAMAFVYFALKKVDYAIIEVGLGGRMDATNVITPILSIITNVHYDHQNILGGKLYQIAYEKGGIIKPSIPAVLGEMEAEPRDKLLQLAKEKNTTIYEYSNQTQFKREDYTLDLKGNYQQKNAKTVVTAIHVLQNQLGVTIEENSIKKGLANVVKNTHLRGRWEVLGTNPLIVCDTAHNQDGITQVVQQIKEQAYQTLHLVLGFVKDKDFETIIDLFPQEAIYYFCEPDLPRKLPVEDIKQKMENKIQAHYFYSPKQALKKAKEQAAAADFIFVGGSNFVVAEII